MSGLLSDLDGVLEEVDAKRLLMILDGYSPSVAWAYKLRVAQEMARVCEEEIEAA